jgi:vancomycin resistance protein YoaR
MASKKALAINKTVLIWTGATLVIAALVFGGAAFAAVGYGRLYDGRIFPGVRVLGVRLDGLTAEEARASVNKAVDEALKDGLRFHYVTNNGETRDVSIAATTVATADPDASHDLVSYNVEPAIVAAAEYGRGNNLVFDTLARWRARVSPVTLDAGTRVDQDALKAAITDALKDVVPGVQDASLRVAWNDAAKRADVTVVPERDGRTLDTESAIRAVRNQAAHLRFSPIELRDRDAKATIVTADAERLKGAVPDVMARAPFSLTYEGKKFAVTPTLLAEWIGIKGQGSGMMVTILPDRFAKGVRTLIPDVEKTAKQGSLVFEDGKIKNFEAGTEGVAINDEATLNTILSSWSSGAATSSYPLLVTRTEPSLTGQDPERLGITEIIGIGRSNFSGSPMNRRKNIANGVRLVNGTLIPPGETFSLLTVLGPIEDGHGWLPELVIKGNETTPELGGGLCQIGTTAFRAALASGLPIVERRNHSYRVRYYEPVGTDATIYDPKPDFRFLNDTNHHVLIHAFTQGDEVIYEFWGTEDGRSTLFKGQAEVTEVADLKPRVFNQVSPPPTKLVETLDLKPGEKKCTETAHAGADAEFSYTVTYADGTQKEEVFRSHYRPWQAVCLIGVEKLSAPPETDPSVGGSPDSAAADAVTP